MGQKKGEIKDCLEIARRASCFNFSEHSVI